MTAGGEGGIRLHPAGRDLACKPSPSNLTRDVRRDIAPSAHKNTRFAAGIFGGGGIPMTYNPVVKPFYGFDL